jgi:hypothetical protein
MCGVGLQVEGAHGAEKPVGLNHLMPTRQQKPWGLFVLGPGLPGAMAAAAGLGDPSLWAVAVLGPACWVWAPEGQYSSTAGMGEPSLQAVGALGPGYTAILVSLVFLGEGSRSCSRGKHGALSSCVYQKAGLTAE